MEIDIGQASRIRGNGGSTNTRNVSGWVTHPWVSEGIGALRFGVQVWPMPADWPKVIDLAHLAEELGFDSFWVGDHPTSRSDCWTTLAALAMTTHTIRLGSLVSCVFYRHPAVLARMAADVDRLSNGRLVLGLGIGDHPGEFAQLGLPFPSVSHRQRALEETIQIVWGMWSEAPFSFEGQHFRVANTRCQPGPVQHPRVPLLIAGGGERVTLRQVAQYADATDFGAHAWTGAAFTVADVARKYAALYRHCQSLGRPYDSVLHSHHTFPLVLAETPGAVQAKLDRSSKEWLMFTQSSRISGIPREVARHYRALAAAGVAYFIATVREDDSESIRLLAEQVRPMLTSSQ
jgi:alkanesulfonate monooxygenase SsuD/methylene tetrahydromethanopterin reductase-like flavin-dependent oxidoreductase (luciferase family)